MKKLLPILFVLIIISCSKEVPFEQTVKRNGITYEVNSEEPFTGTTVSYYENDLLEQRSTLQLKRKENYKDGERDGLFEKYYDNGQLDFKGNYKDGKRDRLFEYYYENGQLMSKSNYKDGKREGLYEFYYENGQIETKSNYKDGEREFGEYYFENGQLDFKVNVKD